MEHQRRSFTEEYKRQAVDLVVSSGRSVTSVAKELGLRDSVLRRWMNKFGREPASATRNPAPPEFQLGVLLVHGIGTPRRGDTLVRWGDALLNTIGHATGKRVVATIERAASSDGIEKGSFEAAVRLCTRDHTERWLLAEGRWAGAFPAPSYRELVSWSVRAVPWSIASHVAQRYWQDTSGDWEWKRAIALGRAVGQLLVALALAPVLIGLLALTLLLGLLPIPQLRTQIAAMQSTLTATVGDSLAFVESPMRAALIQSCIVDGLERLKECCAHTVIAAHSQGAAATLQALGGFAETDGEDEAQSPARLLPDALVTFGAGTNQLASQKLLSSGRLPNDPASAAFGLVLLAGSILWLYWIFLSTTSWLQLLGEAGWALGMSIGGALGLAIYCALGFAIAWLISWLISWLIRLTSWLIKRYEPRGKHMLVPNSSESDYFADIRIRVSNVVFIIVSGIMAASYFVGMFLWWFYDLFPNLPFGPGKFAPGTAFLLSSAMTLTVIAAIAGSIWLILRPEMQTIVSASVRKPPGLARWVDLYASADPVPNGPTKTEGKRPDESIKIWNLGSFVADHTAYWDNRDGFVLRVVRVCAETAQSPWKDALPRISGFVDQRAAWRVRFLRIARWTTSVLWLILGALIWHQMSTEVSFKFPIWLAPAWLPAALGLPALLVALIVLAIWASSSILRWVWNLWVCSEQEAVLAHQPAREVTWEHPFLLTMCGAVWTLIGAIGVIYVLGSDFLSKPWSLAGVKAVLTDTGTVYFFAFIFITSQISSTILLTFWPPPRASDQSGGESIS
ncbi:transposase [Bradyrhizobium jicamae]|uniref:transposase n=1 Tax=Bradyrhizobium jicamae TaxID=280332 RepID=UPI000B0D3560|nr:transposase [Bradyrhizobium jicamae]